jgi:hypothetical protein
MADKEIIRQDVHVLLLILLQSSLIKEIQEFLCFLTQINETEDISFLPKSIHFLQFVYYVLKGLH